MDQKTVIINKDSQTKKDSSQISPTEKEILKNGADKFVDQFSDVIKKLAEE